VVTELRNVGKFLSKRKCKWENQTKKITQRYEEEFEERVHIGARVYRLHSVLLTVKVQDVSCRKIPVTSHSPWVCAFETQHIYIITLNI
jgi:hypothetical protein